MYTKRIKRLLGDAGLDYSEGARLFGVSYHLLRRKVPSEDVLERLEFLEALERDVPSLWAGIVERFRYGYRDEQEEARRRVYEEARRAFNEFAGSPEAVLGGEAPTVPPFEPRPFKVFEDLYPS